MKKKIFIKRVGASNNAFTKGKIYQVYGDRVVNDQDMISRPWLNRPNSDNYWYFVKKKLK